jgi:agmatine deiminase
MHQPPHETGFRMPAEWHPHQATWLAWPHNITDWPGKFHPVPWVFAEVVKHLSECEVVRIVVRDERMEQSARRVLDKADAWRGAITFYRSQTNRCWTRDYLPTFVINEADGRVGAVKWQFNGWAKYDDWRGDEQTGESVARTAADVFWLATDPMSGRRVVLEGGAIDVNGEGFLITTEECLLSEVQQRNPGIRREGYEAVFCDYLNVQHVIWLAGGIAGDDTHGHIDDVARFVAPAKLVLVVDTDPRSPHYEVMQENRRRLRVAQQNWRELDVIELPLPRPVVFAGQRLPASYANFYIANSTVLVPTFNDPNDRIALNILQDAFPDRTVVGIHSLDLVLGLGTLHCMTQQQPLAAANREGARPAT